MYRMRRCFGQNGDGSLLQLPSNPPDPLIITTGRKRNNVRAAITVGALALRQPDD